MRRPGVHTMMCTPLKHTTTMSTVRCNTRNMFSFNIALMSKDITCQSFKNCPHNFNLHPTLPLSPGPRSPKIIRKQFLWETKKPTVVEKDWHRQAFTASLKFSTKKYQPGTLKKYWLVGENLSSWSICTHCLITWSDVATGSPPMARQVLISGKLSASVNLQI